MLILVLIYYLNFHFSNFYQLSSQTYLESSGDYEKDGPTSPNLINNEWYIIGESYAGIYVPTVVRELINRDSVLKNCIKGFAVGDGCVG